LFLALPIGLICGLAQPLLVRWLGADYAQWGPLLALMVFHLCVNVAVYPIFTVQGAANRVRVPAIVTCVMGAGNALLAVALTYRMGMYGVALGGAIMLTAKNVVFSPLYAARVLGCGWHVFFGDILKVLGLTAVVTVLAFGAAHLAALTTWFRLAVAGLLVGLAYVPGVWFAFLSPNERAQLRTQVLAPAMDRVAGVLR
jgi:membrane protein EpsK